MDMHDQIKYDLDPCRANSKIAIGLCAAYNEITAREGDSPRRRVEYGGDDSFVKLSISVWPIESFTLPYIELLETVLDYYNATYKKIPGNLGLIWHHGVQPCKITIVITRDRIYTSMSMISRNRIACDDYPQSISTIQAAFVTRYCESKEHNKRIANLVEMRRAQRNIRIFADELLYVPVYGMHYLAAKERFEQAQREQEVLVCGKMKIVEAEEPLSSTRKRKLGNFECIEATPMLVIQ